MGGRPFFQKYMTPEVTSGSVKPVPSMLKSSAAVGRGPARDQRAPAQRSRHSILLPFLLTKM